LRTSSSAASVAARCGKIKTWRIAESTDWQVIDSIEFTSWLAALDDFRNWLILEAA
jgi:hypothetical protein